MGSPSLPAQPAAPDYAAANRQGIYTDIETLPVRDQINQAAALGQRIEYQDPATGQTRVADFTGMGNAAAAAQAAQILADSNAAMQRQQLALRQELGTANAQQTAAEIQAADPQAYAARQALTHQVLGSLNAAPSNIAPNQQIQSAYDRLNTVAGQAPTNGPELTQLYQRANALGANINDGGQNDQLRSLQADTASTLGALQQRAGNDDGQSTLRALGTQLSDNGSGTLGNIAAALQGQDGRAVLGALGSNLSGNAAQAEGRLNNIYSDANALRTNFDDRSQAAINPALGQAMRDNALGGALSQDQLRNVTNDTRAAQAARGNYLGDAAIVQEVGRQQEASDAIRQQRLQNLMAIQGQVFGQNDALRNESQNAALARIGALQGLQGQGVSQAEGQTGQLASLEAQRFGQLSNSQAQLANVEGQRFGQVGANVDRLAALEGQRFGQAGQAIDRQAALRGQETSTLAALGQQAFGNSQSIRNEQAQNLGQMASLTGQNFGQNQQAYNTQLGAAGSGMNAAGQLAQSQQSNRAENFGYDQQRLANASAMVLGQPLTNQFGSLGSAQQGAVGFTPVNYQQTGQTSATAGQGAANLAGNNFGTLGNMWNTQANVAAQGSPWLSVLGTVGGAALSSMM